ncbi:MAG: RNA methyltransferase [Proteobacteria bacterium]|nr:RNA methyltransferase [Pseudomonadota bacterium]
MTHPVDRLIERYGADTVTEAMRPLLTDERIARIETVLDARLDGVTVALENLHDPHNGAAAIRSLEAVGLTTLHVVEQVEKFSFSPAVTVGCEKWIDIRRHKHVTACAGVLKDAGYQLYAACPDGDCGLDEVAVNRPVCVVFGNEHQGLTERARGLCDRRLAVSMHGFTQSFNLSVSVAVTIHRLAERRRAILGRPGDIDRQKRALLRARWYAHGVRGAEAIIARHVSEQTRQVCTN